MELCKPEPSPMSTVEFPIVPEEEEEETRRLLPKVLM